MKPPYVPLRNLEDKTSDYRVKVTVVHKSPSKQSTKSPTKARFQKLVLEDEEGTRMHATLFNDEIESYQQDLRRDGKYELRGATIKPVPHNHKATIGEYQMNFNSRVKISPINTKHYSDQPRYSNLSSVLEPRDNTRDVFDVVGVVIAMDDIKAVAESNVRQLTIVDNSIQRPMTLSAWNNFASSIGELIPAPAQGLSVVGFIAVEKAKYRGVSLKTTMSKEIIVEPKGPFASTLHTWIKENSTILHSWVTKSYALKGSSSTWVITPVIDIEKRKANTVWQEESFWISVSAPSVYPKGIFCYFGCNKCGRRVHLPPHTTFKCEHCKAAQSLSIPRMSFQFFVTDGEGAIKVIAFPEDAEKILGATTEEIHKQKNNDDSSKLDVISSAVESKQMMLHIAPSSTLTSSYVLKWVVRQVEEATSVKAKGKNIKEPEDDFRVHEGSGVVKSKKDNLVQAEWNHLLANDED